MSGPLVLFDKSFLQALNIDQSVWFDHFFTVIVCPLFYIETLADLKKMGDNTTPEKKVADIAAKFPESSGLPCAFHSTLCKYDLLGNHISMRNQIPHSQGQPIKVDGKSCMVYNPSDEQEAFFRWTNKMFLEVEYNYAEKWRKNLQDLDLEKFAQILREKDINSKSIRTLKDAKTHAKAVINNPEETRKTIKYACDIFEVHTHYSQILTRWTSLGSPPLGKFAPYAAYVLEVYLFFQIACAAKLIGTERKSNIIDISYLCYLPFCQFFVSSDNLHRKCAPLFLRDDQEFIWGAELKEDLTQLNKLYNQLPMETKEKGLSFFAKTPPLDEDFLISKLWKKHGWQLKKQLKESEVNINPSIINNITKMADVLPLPFKDIDFDPKDPDILIIKRRVKRKKGSWYQLPKILQNIKDKNYV